MTDITQPFVRLCVNRSRVGLRYMKQPFVRRTIPLHEYCLFAEDISLKVGTILVKNPGNWESGELFCLLVLWSLSGNQGFRRMSRRRKASFSCQDLQDNYRRFCERHLNNGYYVKIRRKSAFFELVSRFDLFPVHSTSI